MLQALPQQQLPQPQLGLPQQNDMLQASQLQQSMPQQLGMPQQPLQQQGMLLQQMPMPMAQPQQWAAQLPPQQMSWNGQAQQPQTLPVGVGGGAFGYDMNAGVNAMIDQAQQAAFAATQGFAPTGAVAGLAAGRMTGTVKSWYDDKGFGFINPSDGGENIFVHRSNLVDGTTLMQGQMVEYELHFNPQKGKHQVAKCTGATTPGGKVAGTPPAATPSNTGTVKVWFEDKGFGFITPAGGGDDCYVHRTFLADGTVLVVGASVNYTLEWNAAKNKFSAMNVTGAGAVPAGAGGGYGAAATQPAGLRSEPYVGGQAQTPMGMV